MIYNYSESTDPLLALQGNDGADFYFTTYSFNLNDFAIN